MYINTGKSEESRLKTFVSSGIKNSEKWWLVQLGHLKWFLTRLFLDGFLRVGGVGFFLLGCCLRLLELLAESRVLSSS